MKNERGILRVCMRERETNKYRQIERQIDRDRDRERVDDDASYSFVVDVVTFVSKFVDVFLRERNRKRQIGRDKQTENYIYRQRNINGYKDSQRELKLREGYCVCVREKERKIYRQIGRERERVDASASAAFADGMANRQKL